MSDHSSVQLLDSFQRVTVQCVSRTAIYHQSGVLDCCRFKQPRGAVRDATLIVNCSVVCIVLYRVWAER